MGNIYSKSCINCNLKVGDYNTHYMCLLIGKGKYNGKYICANCFYSQIKHKIEAQERNNLVISDDEFKIMSFGELR